MRAKMAVRKKIKWVRGIVYLATNLLNGKQYVGQTIRTLLRRMAAHAASTASRPFANALRNGIPPPEMSEIVRKFRMQYGRQSRGLYKKKVEA